MYNQNAKQGFRSKKYNSSSQRITERQAKLTRQNQQILPFTCNSIYTNNNSNNYSYMITKNDEFQEPSTLKTGKKAEPYSILRVSNLDFAISNNEWEGILRKSFSSITTVHKVRFVNIDDLNEQHNPFTTSGSVNSTVSSDQGTINNQSNLFDWNNNDMMLTTTAKMNKNEASSRKQMFKRNFAVNSLSKIRRNGVAFVTVSNSTDASRVIAKFHHKKIGFKKINVYFAGKADTEIADLNRKVLHALALLTQSSSPPTLKINGSTSNRDYIPLSVFCKKFAALYGRRIHLNELQSLPNTIRLECLNPRSAIEKLHSFENSATSGCLVAPNSVTNLTNNYPDLQNHDWSSIYIVSLVPLPILAPVLNKHETQQNGSHYQQHREQHDTSDANVLNDTSLDSSINSSTSTVSNRGWLNPKFSGISRSSAHICTICNADSKDMINYSSGGTNQENLSMLQAGQHTPKFNFERNTKIGKGGTCSSSLPSPTVSLAKQGTTTAMTTNVAGGTKPSSQQNMNTLIVGPNLRTLTVQTHELMNRHNGNMVLSCFVSCHNQRFGNNSLRFMDDNNITGNSQNACRQINRSSSMNDNNNLNDNNTKYMGSIHNIRIVNTNQCTTTTPGIPIEHFISCIPNIVVKWHKLSALKQINWAQSAKTVSSFHDQFKQQTKRAFGGNKNSNYLDDYHLNYKTKAIPHLRHTLFQLSKQICENSMKYVTDDVDINNSAVSDTFLSTTTINSSSSKSYSNINTKPYSKRNSPLNCFDISSSSSANFDGYYNHNLMQQTQQHQSAKAVHRETFIDIVQLRQIFSRQASMVLERNLLIPISHFLNHYHQRFQRQLRVADYGCSKLVELVNSIPETIQIIGNELFSIHDEDTLTLQHSRQVNRFAGLLFLALTMLNRQHRNITRSRKKFWDLNERVLLSSTVSSRDQEISYITNTSQALFNFDVEETGNVCSKLQRSNNYGYLLNDNYQNDNFTAEYDNCYDEDNTSPKCHYQQRHWVKSTTYNRVQFDGSKSSFVMIEKDDIPKLIKEVLSDLSYKLRPAFNDSCHLIVGNNTDESANTRSINTQNDDFLLFQNQLAGNLSFSIDSFGVTCLDDLVFSVEKFQEFAITSEFIGLNELNILLNMYSTNKSANTQYYCPTCLDKIQLLSRKVVEQSGWSSLSIFSLDFEMTNLLRCCSGFTIRMITIDSFIERLIESQYYHQHHSCRFKHQPSLQNSDNDKQFIPGSLCSHDILEKDAFPVSFAKIAQLADDHGAGWPYATAMMSYFISLKTASVTHNPFTLESALIISNKGNKLRALALNIYELLDEKDIVSVCNLKNQNVDNFTQRKRHDSTSCFGISLLKQVPVSCLKRMYERHFRIVLDPYLHGYSNLQEMLKSMSPSWLDIITDRNSSKVCIRKSRLSQLIRFLVISAVGFFSSSERTCEYTNPVFCSSFSSTAAIDDNKIDNDNVSYDEDVSCQQSDNVTDVSNLTTDCDDDNYTMIGESLGSNIGNSSEFDDYNQYHDDDFSNMTTKATPITLSELRIYLQSRLSIRISDHVLKDQLALLKCCNLIDYIEDDIDDDSILIYPGLMIVFLKRLMYISNEQIQQKTNTDMVINDNRKLNSNKENSNYLKSDHLFDNSKNHCYYDIANKLVSSIKQQRRSELMQASQSYLGKSIRFTTTKSRLSISDVLSRYRLIYKEELHPLAFASVSLISLFQRLQCCQLIKIHTGDVMGQNSLFDVLQIEVNFIRPFRSKTATPQALTRPKEPNFSRQEFVTNEVKGQDRSMSLLLSSSSSSSLSSLSSSSTLPSCNDHIAAKFDDSVRIDSSRFCCWPKQNREVFSNLTNTTQDRLAIRNDDQRRTVKQSKGNALQMGESLFDSRMVNKEFNYRAVYREFVDYETYQQHDNSNKDVNSMIANYQFEIPETVRQQQQLLQPPDFNCQDFNSSLSFNTLQETYQKLTSSVNNGSNYAVNENECVEQLHRMRPAYQIESDIHSKTNITHPLSQTNQLLPGCLQLGTGTGIIPDFSTISPNRFCSQDNTYFYSDNSSNDILQNALPSKYDKNYQATLYNYYMHQFNKIQQDNHLNNNYFNVYQPDENGINQQHYSKTLSDKSLGDESARKLPVIVSSMSYDHGGMVERYDLDRCSNYSFHSVLNGQISDGFDNITNMPSLSIDGCCEFSDTSRLANDEGLSYLKTCDFENGDSIVDDGYSYEDGDTIQRLHKSRQLQERLSVNHFSKIEANSKGAPHNIGIPEMPNSEYTTTSSAAATLSCEDRLWQMNIRDNFTTTFDKLASWAISTTNRLTDITQFE